MKVPLGLLLQHKPSVINKVVLIPLSDICSNPNQPRKHFDPDDLQDLSRSIIANGLLQPVTVRKLQNGRYELIAGERRTMAYRGLGRDRIPAIIEEYDDRQSATLALIENLQRKDLNFFEEAVGIQRLMDHLGLTQCQVSVKLGKAQSTVANKLRLLRFSPEIQDRILEAGLTERHARTLLKLPEERLDSALDHIIHNGCNVEQSEEFVEQLLAQPKEKGRTRVFVVKDLRIFQNSINKAVQMMKMAGIAVDSQKTETDDCLEYHIKIPKSSVYSKKEPQRQLETG